MPDCSTYRSFYSTRRLGESAIVTIDYAADRAMLFFFLGPWVVFSLFMASPLPDVFGTRSSNIRDDVAEALFI